MKVALLMPSALNGGVQRIMINLSKGFLNYGYDVDFLIADATGEMLNNIPKNCNIIDFLINHLTHVHSMVRIN